MGGSVEWAEPSRPSSSPARYSKRIPRGKLPFPVAPTYAPARYAGGAGGVVVGAGMDLADLRRGERIGIAVTEMIVVRANDDVFVGFARKIGKDVAYGGTDGIDVHVES